jgi:D-alanyl-D-alanine carboxypeptidase
MAVSSPQCNLHCKGSWNSPAENYTASPPLLVNSPFRLASVTKPFTALTILKLVEDGVIDINAPASNYLPHWAADTLVKQQGAENASQITPWMLLHHISGMDDHSNMMGYMQLFLENPDMHLTHQGLLEWAADNLKPLYPPGETFSYSDTGFAYLGAMITHLTNMTLAAAVRRATHLDDLCMRSTWWDIFEEHPEGVPPRAGQYFGELDITNIDGTVALYGGTGLISNSEDLVKFARAAHQGRLLSEENMKLLYTTVPTLDDGYGVEYGCGWMWDRLSGLDAWFHLGAFGDWMYYLPEKDLAITGTLNQNSRIMTIFDLVADVVQTALDNSECA